MVIDLNHTAFLKTYCDLRNCQPKLLNFLFANLKEHLKTEPILIAGKNRFHCGDQNENQKFLQHKIETVSDYIAELHIIEDFHQPNKFVRSEKFLIIVLNFLAKKIQRQFKEFLLYQRILFARYMDQSNFEKSLITKVLNARAQFFKTKSLQKTQCFYKRFQESQAMYTQQNTQQSELHNIKEGDQDYDRENDEEEVCQIFLA